MIKKKDITVVVQGPYFKNITGIVLNNIYKNFKDSELIFSTYKGEKIDKKYKKKFKIIYNKILPKTPNSLEPLMYYNYFGHVRTSLNGIKKSSKNYILKTRSDIVYNNSSFLNFFNKFSFFDKKYKILKKRVIISSHYTIDPRKNPLPIHFSDWFFFGLKSDLKKIFNQKYMSKENKKVPLWFLKREKPKFFFNQYMCKYRAEQNLMINFLKKFININLKHGYDHNIKNVILTEKILANNFIVMNPNLISYKCLRHQNFDNNQDLVYFNELITFKKWQKIYKKYCHNKFKNEKVNFLEILKTFLWVTFNLKEAIYRIIQYRKHRIF